MKNNLRQFLFGTSLNDKKVLNIGWLLFRLHIGLSMGIHAGLPKMKDMAAPGWFNDQVAGLGFTFPSPAFWATAASWGEFVGGICIALGLLTRFNALQLTFQFFVVSFMWYESPEPITGMYFQNTLFMSFLLIVFAGGGRYSLDKLIMNKQKIKTVIPVKAMAASLLLLISINSAAQKKPLKGSGKIITKTYSYTGFNKIELQDLDGKVEIETGKPFSITTSIDDNLESLLSVSIRNEELKIELAGNTNNRMYIEETGIHIKISLPAISYIKHRGNGIVYINELAGKKLEVVNGGNGNIVIKGSVDELQVSCSGNGMVNAEQLSAKAVTVKRSGNGNVYINTDNTFTATGSGNGDVVNKGEGFPDAASGISGNGEIKYKNQPVSKQQSRNRMHVKIENETAERTELTVKYPGKGSYGIDVKAGESVKESFPVGTKLYKGGHFTTFKKVVYEVTAEPNQTFTIKNK